MQDLENKLEKLHAHIAAIKQLDDALDNTDGYRLSKDDYYNLCATQVNNIDKIGKLLTKTLPFLIYKYTETDYYIYETDIGATVYVPKSNRKPVEILVNEYFPSMERLRSKTYIYYCNEESINRKAIMDAEYFLSEKSVLNRARFLSHSDFTVYSLLYYCFGRFPKNYRKNCSDKLSELYKERDDIATTKQQYFSDVMQQREEQQAWLREYASKLLEWTDTVDVYEKQADQKYHKMYFCIRNGKMSATEF